MAFTIDVANHFFLIGQFLGLTGSFSQSSSKSEEVSSTLPAELRSLLTELAFSPLACVKEVATDGTVVSTATDIVPNGSRVAQGFIRPVVV